MMGGRVNSTVAGALLRPEVFLAHTPKNKPNVS